MAYNYTTVNSQQVQLELQVVDSVSLSPLSPSNCGVQGVEQMMRTQGSGWISDGIVTIQRRLELAEASLQER